MADETVVYSNSEVTISVWSNPKPCTLLIKPNHPGAEIELCLGDEVDEFCALLKKLNAQASDAT